MRHDMRWKYFFTYEEDIPADKGFGMFGTVHVCWLLAIALFVGIFLCRYTGWNDGKRQRAHRCIGGVLVSLILLRILIICIIGRMSVYELPLHLCSLAGILCLLHGIFGWDGLGQVLYVLCLPGTVFALVFPNWTYYPAFHFITLQSFLFHGGIVLYVLCRLSDGGIVPDIRKLWKAVLFLALLVPPVYMFNRRFHTNFLFIRHPSADSPLEWLAERLGIPGYLKGYAVMAAAVMLLMYGLYGLYAAVERKKRKHRI